MSLITSISGIRGTIGGADGEGLNPFNITRFTAAFGTFIREHSPRQSQRIVVGRDARISGMMVRDLVVGTLQGLGYEVIDIGLATTPTTELAVCRAEADGGIIITASHNPREWNALKLLNHEGEFLTAAEGEAVLQLSQSEHLHFATIEQLKPVVQRSFLQEHIDTILALKEVDAEAIKAAGLTIVLDTINSVGGIAVPPLLKALGVQKVITINGEPTGAFAHNPEPLPQHLIELSERVCSEGADVGFAVDPDVDRLAIYCEDGTPFGEEYTLVSVADYLLSMYPGENTVSNLSSTRALRDITRKHGGQYYAAAVGEVNVTTKMKEVQALIGGEGNGGVIFPRIHYGRDALTGIALFLTHLAKSGRTTSEIRQALPQYFMAKKRVDLSPSTDIDALLNKVEQAYKGKAEMTTIDGVKLDFERGWVHVRKSNTEPIIRIYSEAPSPEEADNLANEIINLIKEIL